MQHTKSHYDVLGVSPTATQDEVKKAYLLRSKMLHPDRFDQNRQRAEWELANELLKELNHAYGALRESAAHTHCARPGGHSGSAPPPGPSSARRSPQPPAGRKSSSSKAGNSFKRYAPVCVAAATTLFVIIAGINSGKPTSLANRSSSVRPSNFSSKTNEQLEREASERNARLDRLFNEVVHPVSSPRSTQRTDTYIPTNNGIVYDLYPEKQGLGILRIENGTNHCAIAKLIERVSDIKICSFIIRANSSGGINGIPDGRYRLIFAFGDAVIRGTDRFDNPFGFAAFNDLFPFATRPAFDGTEYSSFRVTLQKVIGGNASSVPLSKEEFDRY